MEKDLEYRLIKEKGIHCNKIVWIRYKLQQRRRFLFIYYWTTIKDTQDTYIASQWKEQHSLIVKKPYYPIF